VGVSVLVYGGLRRRPFERPYTRYMYMHMYVTPSISSYRLYFMHRTWHRTLGSWVRGRSTVGFMVATVRRKAPARARSDVEYTLHLHL
jgi:hypothetical protein